MQTPRSQGNSVQSIVGPHVVSDSIVLDVAFTYCGGVVGLLAPSVVVVVLVVVDVELLGLLVFALV
jgi:hypothetical protein